KNYLSHITHNKSFFLASFVMLMMACKSTKIVENTVVETPKEVVEEVVEEEPKEELGDILTEYLSLKYPDKNFEKYLYISVKHQKMYLIENGKTVKTYPISTAKKGIGSHQNSNKTPPGLHTVKRKIGEEVPLGGILEAREFNGKVAEIITDQRKADGDYVTTRILWLDGEEIGLNKGRNVDSYNRYIYIHGTPEEGYIGQPASHGCIRMKNTDVMELYDLVEEGTPIYILKR
ncbi:MAG TPA: L,D-transpeptidase, partial [Vicingaceae bacterium]|nr:L,D-transpeptidase [Vicingaceae bacterium]